MKNRLYLLLLVLLSYQCSVDEPKSAYDHVNPFIGTGGHGHTYPGATMPFGMVQLSPDTRLEGWDGCSGYHFDDEHVYGFSHTHLSGTGVSDYGDILFMPTTGEIRWNNGSDAEEGEKTGYRSAFKKNKEIAQPGYYSTFLEDYKIRAELTTTTRTGVHRYTFPKSVEANILIDLEHRDKVINSELTIVNDKEIEGFRQSNAWAENQHVYFVARFSEPFKTYGLAKNDTLQAGAKTLKGKNIKGYVQFEKKKRGSVIIQVGISAVSIEGARKNLDAESVDFDFDKAQEAVVEAWKKQLAKIEITGGTNDKRTVFYTALYHNSLNPNTFSDVDGRYRGMDSRIHQAKDHTQYTVFSLWDTYRATHPLFTITEQEKTVDFIKTFLQQYKEGGRLPIWELSANYTNCMIGYHAIPVIVDAYMKGIRDYDVELAYEAMKHSAELNHFGLNHYKQYGFIPSDKEAEGVSKTLEYAYDDWCIAQMAKDMGKMKDYEYFIKRAQSYKNVFDPETGFMRPKMNNTWYSPFYPSEVTFHYTEANPWQYSFYVPQDIDGLMELLGGAEKLDVKLDALFTADSETLGRNQVDITGLIGQYAHGNEPSHHMAYLYNYAERPWETQQLLPQITDFFYTTEPDGLIGNEDCGQMSAWYVMTALGFYPVTPGNNIYTIGAPIFPEAKISLENGKSFIIKANNVSATNIYIQSAKLNDSLYTKSFLHHADIMAGGELVFEMGPKQNKEWGVGKGNVPHTAIKEHLISPIPFVKEGSRSFKNSLTIKLGSVVDTARIYYTLDGSEPTLESPLFLDSVIVTENTTIKAFSKLGGRERSATMTAEFSKMPKNRRIKLKSIYASQYSGGGDNALIDLIRGPLDFRTGSWQGYQGIDVEVIVDLGSVQQVSSIALGCLQDQNSWIFMPESVEFHVSSDGKHFSKFGKVNNTIPDLTHTPVISDFAIEQKIKTRYIKVKVKNRKEVPEWHIGAGGGAWVFLDEVVVK